MKFSFSTWKQDLPSGLVVFLVALPLCLGIGLASTNLEGIDGLPNLFTGIIPGIIGGVVVGALSGSRLGVAGPAAGLITIVTAAILTLGSYQGFLLAVVLAGVLQVVAGYLKAGVIGNYFPTAVIKGMLAAIGITLILKEIPHAVGYDKDFFGDEAFFQKDGHNTFSEIFYALDAFEMGAIIIALVSVFILILFERPFMKRFALFSILPGALFVVLFGILMNVIFGFVAPDWVIGGKHLVALPIATSFSEFFSFFSTPDWSFFSNPNVYVFAFTLALVGSLETLLSVEATDKLDPERFQTPTNRELKAQGVGNILSGMIGGLPITQVIVRSSANINSGAKSKMSTIIHGMLLLASVAFIPKLLNLIPLASLAAILLMIGYKLAKVQLFKQMYRLGWSQFLPFIGTIVAVLLTDLLKGIGVGMAIAVFYILKNNYQNNFKIDCEREEVADTDSIAITLSEEVSFLNKGGLADILEKLQNDTKVSIDGSRCKNIDYDVKEYLLEFIRITAPNKNITVEIQGISSLTEELNQIA